MRSASALALLGLFAALGCAREVPSAPPAEAAGPQAQQAPAPLGQVGAARVVDRQSVQNDLRQIALFYKTYEAEFGRVKSAEAFRNYIRRDARKLVKELEDNVYVVVPRARADSTTVIAYERMPDAAGQHVVAMGDGSVQYMTTQQLRAAVPK